MQRKRIAFETQKLSFWKTGELTLRSTVLKTALMMLCGYIFLVLFLCENLFDAGIVGLHLLSHHLGIHSDSTLSALVRCWHDCGRIGFLRWCLTGSARGGIGLRFLHAMAGSAWAGLGEGLGKLLVQLEQLRGLRLVEFILFHHSLGALFGHFVLVEMTAAAFWGRLAHAGERQAQEGHKAENRFLHSDMFLE